MATTRTTLGRNFGEGARLAWLALRRLEWTASDLRERMTGPTGDTIGVGVVDRILYGDGLPSIGSAAQLHELLGVPFTAWTKAPTRPFVLPAASRAAKMGSTRSARNPSHVRKTAEKRASSGTRSGARRAS